jgi:hypothetical protein
MAHGAWTSVGEFTSHAYDETISNGEDLSELLFAADKDSLGSCISAMGSWIAIAYPEVVAQYDHSWQYGPEAIGMYGALCVFKLGEEDFERKPEFSTRWHPSDDYPQIEPGDYYRDAGLQVDYVLTGKKLVRFLMKHDSAWRKQAVERTQQHTRSLQMAESEAAPDVITLAIHKYGVTRDWNEAGYIVPFRRINTLLLDFSGKHEHPGYEKQMEPWGRPTPRAELPYHRLKPGERFDDLRGQRYTDHRDVSELLPGPHESDTDAMYAFLRQTGAARVIGDEGITLAGDPNQWVINRALREFRAYNSEPIRIDYLDDANREHSREFGRKFSTAGVLKWIALIRAGKIE